MIHVYQKVGNTYSTRLKPEPKLTHKLGPAQRGKALEYLSKNIFTKPEVDDETLTKTLLYP